MVENFKTFSHISAAIFGKNAKFQKINLLNNLTIVLGFLDILPLGGVVECFKTFGNNSALVLSRSVKFNTTNLLNK